MQCNQLPISNTIIILSCKNVQQQPLSSIGSHSSLTFCDGDTLTAILLTRF